MDFRISFHPSAQQEWLNVIDWYNTKKKGLGFEVFEEIDVFLKIIKENPYLYQERFDTVRVIFTKRFHFGIHYILNEKRKEIFVVAILNAREDISKMLNRL